MFIEISKEEMEKNFYNLIKLTGMRKKKDESIEDLKLRAIRKHEQRRIKQRKEQEKYFNKRVLLF